MEPRHLQHHQQQPSPPPLWYGPSTLYPHPQHQPPPFAHYPPRAPPPPQPHPIPQWPDYTPAGAPPPPPGSLPVYHHAPPPYPAPLPRYGFAPPPAPAPPPGQMWGNSTWHQQQGWDHPDRSLAFTNEDDWAARARAWAEANSVTESHSAVPFSHGGRMDVQNHYHDNHSQPTIGHSRENMQSSMPATQNLSYSTADYQKQELHLQESSHTNLESTYLADPRASYNSRSEGLVLDKVKGTSTQVNFSSTSSNFEQEVPYSYSSSSGRENEDQYERQQMTLPPPLPFGQDGIHNSQPMPPFQSTSMERLHTVYPRQFASAPSDASDQPLVFEQSYMVEQGLNTKINYRDANITGALGGMERTEASLPSHAWTPSIPFSQPAAVTQQFDSSHGNPSNVAGDPTLVFGRVPGPNFPPNIPPVVPFGLGSGAPLHPSAAFSEDANGTFAHVERPKKPSVPNWLREELIKKKVSIASSSIDQPTIVSRSVGISDDDGSIGKSEQVSKNTASSVSDDEDEEDDVEVARAAAINQEIKRILTDVLLKVTDELFEEIAAKVINEDGSSSEVDNTVVTTNIVSPTSTTPKIAARVTVPLRTNTENVSNVKNSSTVPPEGNLLGLANYNSDDEEDENVNSSTMSSVPMTDLSSRPKNDATSTKGSDTIGKRASGEKSVAPPVNDVKRTLEVGSLHLKTSLHDVDNNNANASRPVSLSSGVTDEVFSEQRNDHGSKVSREGKSSGMFELPHVFADSGQSTSDETRNSKEKSGFVSGHPDKSSTGNDLIKDKKDIKSVRDNGLSVVIEHKRDDTTNRIKERLDEQDSLQRTSKGHTSRKRDSQETDLDDSRGAVKDKKSKSKDDDRKREQEKNFHEKRSGQGERHSHRSKSRRSPSPVSRSVNNKDNSVSCFGIASSGEPPEDTKHRRSHFNRRSISKSPPRSRRRQVSRSPHSKHSQRKHSPYSYSEKRRRSRSTSPVQRRR